MRRCLAGTIRGIAGSVVILWCSHAAALPFNTDMVNVQPRAGAIMRPKPDGSVAVGSLDRFVESKEAATALVNPVKSDEKSVLRGARLFAVNCSPCHGDITKTPYAPGPVAEKFVMPPDITNDFYKQKPDGLFYATIEFGGLAVMPAMGWKLSPAEHWDIVNYVRSVQRTK